MVSEGKFYGSDDERRLNVIRSIASCKMRAVCVTVNKEDATGPFKGVYGKDLYLRTFEELMSMVGDIACGSDIDIAVDQQRFVKTVALRDVAQGWLLDAMSRNAIRRYRRMIVRYRSLIS